jgi:hypothetical protein
MNFRYRRSFAATNLLVVSAVLNLKVRKRKIRKGYVILAKEPLADYVIIILSINVKA